MSLWVPQLLVPSCSPSIELFRVQPVGKPL